MADLLLDTDVLVDHLRGAARLVTGRHRAHVSVVTRAELMSGTSSSATIATLLAPFREVTVDTEVADRTGRVSRESGIRLPDALIAATALVHGLIVVTRNSRDFQAVRGLRVRLPL